MDGVGAPQALFAPNPDTIERSQLTAFTRYCAERTGRSFVDFADFHRFSVQDSNRFWRLFLDWSALPHEGSLEPVVTDAPCEQATFFPHLRLNYAETVLDAPGSGDHQVAVTSVLADGATVQITRGELRARVMRLGEALRRLGVQPGDHVAAIAYNRIETVVAALAAAAIGAAFSIAAPEMGAAAMVGRFGQLAPVALLGHLRAAQANTPTPLAERIREVANALPSLRAVIALDDGSGPAGLRAPLHSMFDLMAETPTPAKPLTRWRFNHPLFILFTSGTTGRPKCLVHGAGGTVIEHVKEHRLHCDLRSGDRLFFQTSCAWMMWNWQLSALASGAEIVLYDGPIHDAGTLWRLVAQQRVTVFGTSPAYLRLSQEADLSPGRQFDLCALRAVLSTGSILQDGQFDWVMRAVKPLPLQSISGGTDIIGCFLLGNPNLPVFRGELQCPSLGYDVAAIECDDRGVGELVCRNPFPSRPLGIYGDPDGSRFHASYFSRGPDMWLHGDRVELAASGRARVHGRSDGVLNVNGIRIGPAEIYAILEDLPEIREAMAVERSATDDRSSRMVLLVVLREGIVLDDALTLRIKRDLARRASPAHVPDIIVQVKALPMTHSGKRSERAAHDAVDGRPVKNIEALLNPECLGEIAQHPALRQHPAVTVPSSASPVRWLQDVWRNIFGMSSIGINENFFDLGGDSFRALALFAEIRRMTGRALPLSTILHAPTIASLAALVAVESPPAASSCLVLVKSGVSGRPLFLIHGGGGSVVLLGRLVWRLALDRPVYAVQARGLDPRHPPDRDVETMARRYLDEIRKVQPDGPYAICGFSFGGLVAYEMACMLERGGAPIELLGLIDTYRPGVRNMVVFQVHRILESLQKLRVAPRRERVAKLLRCLHRGFDQLSAMSAKGYDSAAARKRLQPDQAVWDATTRAAMVYRPGRFGGRVCFYRARERGPGFRLRGDPLALWVKLVDRLEVYDIPGAHASMIVDEPNIAALANALSRALA